MVLPLLLAAVLAVLVVAFLLIARQALVVILILASPLAFVAMLLPNTEKYFKKWLELLLTMLTMFPLVSIVFGGAQIAGLAILSTAATAKDPTSAALAIVIGQLVMVVPFFFLFALIGKVSSSQLGAMAGKLRATGRRAIGGVKKLTNPIAQRKLGLAQSRLQTGDIRRRYNRRGRETLGSRLGGASASLVGGVLNSFGQSKYVDEAHTKANQQDVQRRYADSAAGQVADAALRTAGIEHDISEGARAAHFEATAPLDLKLRAKLADERLKVEKDATSRAGVDAATLIARAARLRAEGDLAGAARATAEATTAAGGDLAVAHGLHDAHTAAAVTSQATNIATRLQQEEFAKQLQADPGLVDQAAGIGDTAARSTVLASARSVVTEGH